MDRMSGFEPDDAGSTPAEGTKIKRTCGAIG